MTAHLTHRRRKETAEGTLDQYFTQSSLIAHYASVIEEQCSQRIFVDTSCGTGEMGLLLHRKGFTVHMYDVDEQYVMPAVSRALQDASRTLCDTFTFEKKDWMTVSELPKDCIVGFNPPFGYKGKVSREFAAHGAQLGCATLCWLSSYMLGPMKRPWVPPGFIEKYYELVPNNAFTTMDGTSKSACAGFHVWAADPGGYAEMQAAWKQEDTRPLPEDWSFERLSHKMGTLKAQPVGDLPRSEDELLLRTSGGDSGRSGVWWRSDAGFEQINDHGTRNPLADSDIRSMTQTTIVKMPPRFRGTKRMDFLQQAAPHFKQVRREASNKQGINFVDIRRVIFAIDDQ